MFVFLIKSFQFFIVIVIVIICKTFSRTTVRIFFTFLHNFHFVSKIYLILSAQKINRRKKVCVFLQAFPSGEPFYLRAHFSFWMMMTIFFLVRKREYLQSVCQRKFIHFLFPFRWRTRKSISPLSFLLPEFHEDVSVRVSVMGKIYSSAEDLSILHILLPFSIQSTI